MRSKAKFTAKYTLNFNPDNWDIRCSSDKNMMIFIPKNAPIDPNNPSVTYKTYLDQLNTISIVGQKADEKNAKNKALSDGELKLGIKLNQLEKIADPFKFPTDSIDHCNTNAVGTRIKMDYYLREILVSLSDLNKRNIDEAALNYWDILLSGHGNNQYVAGMPHEAFAELLDFLNTSINTRSFFYISCHSGAHLEKPYQFKRKKQTQEKDLDFLVIASSVFDLVVSSGINHLSFPSYFTAINAYFKTIQQSNVAPKLAARKSEQRLLDAFDSFFIVKLNHDPTAPTVLQYPAIRFPHTGWFTIPNAQPYGTFVINDSLIMRSINKGKTAITIDPKFTTLIIESHYIPIPLKFSGATMPLLVPKNVSAPIFFKEINAPSCTLATFDSMLKGLMRLGNTGEYTPLITSPFHIGKFILKDYHHDLVIVTPGEAFKTSKSNDPSSQFVKDFNNTKNKVRAHSKLPDSMKIESPKPVIQGLGSRKPTDTAPSTKWKKEKNPKTGKIEWRPTI
jgi:hypothetical protein